MKKPRVIIVMPAYYAAKTLGKTLKSIPLRLAEEIILVDDASRDETAKIARRLGLTVFKHYSNLGYGGNQKTCYWEALKRKPEIVVMLHPDYQYDGGLTGKLIEPIVNGDFDIVLGNRVRTRRQVLKGGMPLYKYLGNRLLTIVENIALGQNLPEWHTGFRAYHRRVLEKIPFQRFSNDFVFDSQFLISAVAMGFRIGSVNVPCRYSFESSSINIKRSLLYGAGTIYYVFLYLLHKIGIKNKLFQE